MSAEWTIEAGRAESGRAEEGAAAEMSGAGVRCEGRIVADRRWGRGGRSRSSLSSVGGIFAFGIAAMASSVSAHTANVPIPPESDYMVRWHQPHSVRPVDDWEIEVTPVRRPSGRFIATAQVVPEASCWALNVPIAEPATVRIRSVVGTQVSAWTRPTVVPEPGLVASLASATGALAYLARRARVRTRSRRAPTR